jgi:hypothetical protein
LDRKALSRFIRRVHDIDILTNRKVHDASRFQFSKHIDVV